MTPCASSHSSSSGRDLIYNPARHARNRSFLRAHDNQGGNLPSASTFAKTLRCESLGNATISRGERFFVGKSPSMIEYAACRTPSPVVRESKWWTPQRGNFLKLYPLLVLDRSAFSPRGNPSTGSLLRIPVVYPQRRGEGDQRC